MLVEVACTTSEGKKRKIKMVNFVFCFFGFFTTINNFYKKSILLHEEVIQKQATDPVDYNLSTSCQWVASLSAEKMV